MQRNKAIDSRSALEKTGPQGQTPLQTSFLKIFNLKIVVNQPYACDVTEFLIIIFLI